MTLEKIREASKAALAEAREEMKAQEQAAPVRRGFKLFCPMCGKDGSEDTLISVYLHNTSEFHCSDCEADFTVDDVRSRVEPWLRVIAWCESADLLND